MSLARTLRNLSMLTAWVATTVIGINEPGLARQGERRISPYHLVLDPHFRFNAPHLEMLPSNDCRYLAGATAEFERLAQQGSTFAYFEHGAARRFLSFAFANVDAAASANLDRIEVEKLADGQYRVYSGSSQIVGMGGQRAVIYCGFAQPQYLNAEWAQAGFQNQALYEQLPDPTEAEIALEKLSNAYYGMSYDRVRESMKKRGFTPVDLKSKAVDRCDPGLETICEQYAEALCDESKIKVANLCMFAWTDSQGNRIAAGVKIGMVTKFYTELSVVGLMLN